MFTLPHPPANRPSLRLLALLALLLPLLAACGGAARVLEVGPSHLTMTAGEMVVAARAFPNAVIVPLHYAGWAHFSEGRTEIEHAFVAARLTGRLLWLPPGRATELAPI